VGSQFGLGRRGHGPLDDIPAVVAARDERVQLLPRALADVADEVAAVRGPEGKAKRIAQTVRVDLLARTDAGRLAGGVAAPARGLGLERIARGGAAVAVDAQHLAAQRVQGLRRPVGHPPVTDRDVQLAVETELDVAPVVIPPVGRNVVEDDGLAGGDEPWRRGEARDAILG
jgi:hypothetical protein